MLLDLIMNFRDSQSESVRVFKNNMRFFFAFEWFSSKVRCGKWVCLAARQHKYVFLHQTAQNIQNFISTDKKEEILKVKKKVTTSNDLLVYCPRYIPLIFDCEMLSEISYCEMVILKAVEKRKMENTRGKHTSKAIRWEENWKT